MRILHTMIRVGNVERSVEFYSKVLGMKVLRQKDYPKGEFTNTFMGYGDESKEPALELTYNWGVETYTHGTGFGHLAVQVEDVYDAVTHAKSLGAEVMREAGPMNGGERIIAFLKDPDGYEIELLSQDQQAR